MPKGIEGPTWALLPPSNLPDDDERATLLGSIVGDFERPLGKYVPENVSNIIPPNLLGKPTEDTNFKVVLTRAHGQGAHRRLADILQATFSKDAKDEAHLATTIVQTYELKRQDHIFGVLKRMFMDEILSMIDEAPSRNRGAVFMVVAIKTCIDAKICSRSSKDEKASAGATVLATTIAMANTNTAVVPNIDVEGNMSCTQNITAEDAHIAKGARIFAIQYRLIKRESLWLRTVMPRKPNFSMGEYFSPKGSTMFGSEKDGEAEGTDDEERLEDFHDLELQEDEDDVDPIQLGDLQHTWALDPSDECGVVMTML
jgi:hypothetical protein